MAAVMRQASFLGSLTSHAFLAPKKVMRPQVCGLVSKLMRDPDYKRAKPYPYKKRPYTFLASLFDFTSKRFDENTKLIVVEGSIASGKDVYAKKIAEEFDLLYIPHVNFDNLLITKYGHDMRKYDDEMPFMMRSFEPQHFLANPMDKRAARLQINFLNLRLSQYIDALAHILNTGQGVVMNRCVYSDFVFLETYLKFGFYPKTMKDIYYKKVSVMEHHLLRPHLVIYFDTPVETIIKNLKKRNNPVEINSPVNKPEVLLELEKNYKTYLQQISSHADLLVYDNSQPIDLEIIVEDIERVNLDKYTWRDRKMMDWRPPRESIWNAYRISFSSERESIEGYTELIPETECEELFITMDEVLDYKKVFEKVPGNKYQYGYNADCGDSVLFKS